MDDTRNLLIVVPARGGSKGLARKNTLSLGGFSLLSWTAEAVRRAALPGAVCLLSTDDPEIAEIGRAAGLEAPFLRPAEFATDEASVTAVALHALEWLKANRGTEADRIMLLQPTSPFRPPAALEQSVAMLAADPNANAIIGVKPVYRSPATLFYADSTMHLAPLGENPETNARRQHGHPLFTPNGALYLIRADVLRSTRSFFPAKSVGIAMNQVESLDIDDPLDFEIAEAIVKNGLALA